MLRGSISGVDITEIGGAGGAELIVILSYKLEVSSKSIKSLLSSASPKTMLDVISTSALSSCYVLLLFLTVEALSSSHGGSSELTITAPAYRSTSSRYKVGGMGVKATKASNYSPLTAASSGATRSLKDTLL